MNAAASVRSKETPDLLGRVDFLAHAANQPDGRVGLAARPVVAAALDLIKAHGAPVTAFRALVEPVRGLIFRIGIDEIGRVLPMAALEREEVLERPDRRPGFAALDPKHAHRTAVPGDE